jgi:hypothetical protein
MSSSKVFESIARGAALLAAERLPEPLPLPDTDWDFATQCCLTFDEERAGDPTSVVVKPFPSWDYLKIVVDTIEREQKLRIDKSGQVLISWAILSHMLHQVLVHKGYRIAYYCQTSTKAEAHLQSRLYRMYLAIPPEYAKPHAEYNNGQFLVYHDGKDKLPTAFIIPQATEQKLIDAAAEKMRSETWTEAVIDEGAFPRNLKELVNSLIPRCGKIIIPSTVNGLGYFHDLGFANIHDVQEQATNFDGLEKDELHKGVWKWKRNGFTHLRVHYSAHPERDPDTAKGQAWLASKRESMSTDLWNREQEISYDVQPGMPVFVDTDRIRFVEQCYQSNLRFFGGTDCGFLWPFWYDFQVEPIEDNGRRVGEIIHVLHEHVQPNTEVYTFGQWVKAERQRIYGRRDWTDYADDAANQRKEAGQVAAILRSQGFTIITKPTGPGGVLKRCTLLQRFISAGCLEIDPQCKFLATALKSGYVRDENGEPVGGDKGHPFCDSADAIGYGLYNLFTYEYQPRGSQRVLNGPDLPTAQPQPPLRHDANAHPASEIVLTSNQGGNTKLPMPAVHTQRVYQPRVFDPRESVKNRWRK